MDQLYLDNIDEYVHDQDKIVTYKWLSLTLGVHVNTAKQMLYHYLEHKRKESSGPLHATYLVSGKSVDNGQTCHKVSVVREEELEEAKSKLSAVVSVHVYSVHKALLRDSAPLYSADYDAVKNNLLDCNRYSAIRCPAAVPLSTAEVQQARETQQTPPPEVHKRESNSGAKTCPKPKGIMGAFNKAAPKTQETKGEARVEEPAVDVPKSKPAAKTNPAANFFGNQAGKKPVKAVKEEETVQSSSTSEPQKQDVPTEQPPPPPSPPAETKRDARSKSKRLEESDSEEEKMEKKKRRRIKKPVADSSDEDMIPDSPEQSTRQTSPGPVREEPVARVQKIENPLKTRKRRRVLKSHTFLDEDGSMVTEKVYESESYSESDEDAQRKPAPRAAPGKPQNKPRDEEKKSQKKTPASGSNRGSKQASIRGFFQKK